MLCRLPHETLVRLIVDKVAAIAIDTQPHIRRRSPLTRGFYFFYDIVRVSTLGCTCRALRDAVTEWRRDRRSLLEDAFDALTERLDAVFRTKVGDTLVQIDHFERLTSIIDVSWYDHRHSREIIVRLRRDCVEFRYTIPVAESSRPAPLGYRLRFFDLKGERAGCVIAEEDGRPARLLGYCVEPFELIARWYALPWDPATMHE